MIVGKIFENEKINLKTSVILLLCGFLVFSPISSKITMNILKFPLALPELLFFPFYFFLKNRIDLTINKKVLFFGLFLIIFLVVISFLVDNFPPSSILSTARGYFYMIVSFSIFLNKELRNISYIMFMAFGSVIGWLFDALLFFNNLANNLLNDDTAFAVYGNMIMLSLAMSIPIIFKKNKYVYVAFLSGLLLSFITGVRRQIIIFVSSFILSLFLSIKWTIKGLAKIILFVLILFSFLTTIYPIAEQYVYDISPILHHRVFKKSEQLITGERNESDEVRSSSIIEFFDSFEENIFPRGFVSKRTMQDKEAGLYMDSPIYEIFYTFSIGGALIILVMFITRFFFHLKNYYFYGIKESGVCLVSLLTIIILLMLEGSFLNFTYITPCTGFVIARIFSNKNLVKI
jgi:hypothetical protein